MVLRHEYPVPIPPSPCPPPVWEVPRVQERGASGGFCWRMILEQERIDSEGPLVCDPSDLSPRLGYSITSRWRG